MKKISASQLFSYLNDLFPQCDAAEWDKVGLQIPEVFGSLNQDYIHNPVICLDVTTEVVDYAIEKKSNLIISRHPFIFKEYDEEMKDEAKNKNYQRLVENGIQIFSIHTNYDASDKQSLINLLEYKLNIKSFNRLPEAKDVIRIKLLNEISYKNFIEDIKFIFGSSNSKCSRNVDTDSYLNEFYICTGAGASYISYSKLKNITFVTGEAKWSDYIYSVENNVKLITVGHYMENYFIDDISTKLIKTFGNELDCYSYDIKNMWKAL